MNAQIDRGHEQLYITPLLFEVDEWDLCEYLLYCI